MVKDTLFGDDDDSSYEGSEYTDEDVDDGSTADPASLDPYYNFGVEPNQIEPKPSQIEPNRAKSSLILAEGEKEHNLTTPKK